MQLTFDLCILLLLRMTLTRCYRNGAEIVQVVPTCRTELCRFSFLVLFVWRSEWGHCRGSFLGLKNLEAKRTYSSSTVRVSTAAAMANLMMNEVAKAVEVAYKADRGRRVRRNLHRYSVTFSLYRVPCA